MKRELDKLHKSLGGIRNMAKTPSALWMVDTKKEHLAIDEANKLGIPVIGILDTNCDPDEVDYPIPGNDDAIRSVSLLTRIIADAAAEGLIERSPEARGRGRPSRPSTSRSPSGSTSSCQAGAAQTAEQASAETEAGETAAEAKEEAAEVVDEAGERRAEARGRRRGRGREAESERP